MMRLYSRWGMAMISVEDPDTPAVIAFVIAVFTGCGR